LHASRLCEKLDIDALLIPPGAGVGSAIGFLRAPFGFEAVRGAFLRLSEFDADWTSRLIAELGEEAERFARAGAPDAALVREIKAYMRYQGQGWEIVVMLPNRDFVDGDATEFRRLFETEYRRLFVRALDGLDIEIMNWSVQVRSELLQSTRVEPVGQVKSRHSDELRRIFDAREQRFVDAAVYQRDDLQSGDRIDGPAVIIERETSTVVTSRYAAIRQPDGCLLLTQKGNN
jgi:N-methylhydantoinase A